MCVKHGCQILSSVIGNDAATYHDYICMWDCSVLLTFFCCTFRYFPLFKIIQDSPEYLFCKVTFDLWFLIKTSKSLQSTTGRMLPFFHLVITVTMQSQGRPHTSCKFEHLRGPGPLSHCCICFSRWISANMMAQNSAYSSQRKAIYQKANKLVIVFY